MFTVRVAMDTFTLAQGWKKVLYRQQPWKGSLEAISQQGFKQEDDMKGFGVMNPPNFSKDGGFVE
jgi:hypothetical protein